MNYQEYSKLKSEACNFIRSTGKFKTPNNMITFILEKVWSSNIFLPKMNIIKTKSGNDMYYSTGGSNKIGRATYRLRPRLVLKSKIKS